MVFLLVGFGSLSKIFMKLQTIPMVSVLPFWKLLRSLKRVYLNLFFRIPVQLSIDGKHANNYKKFFSHNHLYGIQKMSTW